MNKTTAMYHVNCMGEPRSDMAAMNNPACKMMTYHGGLQCCRHSWYLTDVEQNAESTSVDLYYMKWRYYFQEYTPATETKPASHKHLHHWVFLIDAQVNDYEEDPKTPHDHTKQTGEIHANLTAARMGLEDVPKGYKTITPLVIAAHCHAPSCLMQELWNVDTNELICRVTAQYGTGKDIYNEANYVALPPCIFGYEPGLKKPVTLKPETKLRAFKVFNNTYRHLGQMAQWTGLMMYDNDPY